jgi:hypothetical protein
MERCFTRLIPGSVNKVSSKSGIVKKITGKIAPCNYKYLILPNKKKYVTLKTGI